MKIIRLLTLLCIIIMLVCMLSGCIFFLPIDFGPKETTTPVSTPSPAYQAWNEWRSMAEDKLPEYIPLDVILSFSEYTAPQISADGTKIAYRYTSDAEDTVKIMDWQSGDTIDVPWPPEGYGIPYFVLMPDGYHVLFFIDDHGDENYGVYLTNTKTQTSVTIIQSGFTSCGFSGFHPLDQGKFFIHTLNTKTKAYDILLYDVDDVESDEEWTADVILKNPGNIINWEFDSKGELALVETINEDASQHVYRWENPLGEPILAWDYEDTDTSSVISYYDERDTILVLDSTYTDATAVYEYDMLTKEHTLISTDEQGIHEPAGTWINIDTYEVEGVAYQRERIEWQCYDDTFRSHVDYLTSLSDGDMDIVGSNADDHYWLISFDYDVKAADYYIYNSKKQEATFLYNANSNLDGYTYAPMVPIQYQSSDDLTIHGYVTFPVNLEQENLPMVVLVHGGPWTRDTWGFNPEVQFLANRGYMVLQVNFRGSTGYGKEFMLAGDMEWGRKMHQDILDAVDWATEQGWADPDRIALYGASYGGYEALVGATLSPDRFACAVDCFGPSSLLTLAGSMPPQWSSTAKNMYRSIGDPDKDADIMRERSPYYRAEDISIPLLVVQGGNDVRVTQRESDQLVDKMREAGIPVEYILFPDAGHGFSNEEQIETFYYALERFLAEHIGGIDKVPQS